MKTIICSLAFMLAILPVAIRSALAQIPRETDPFVEEAIEDKPYTQITDRLAARFGGTFEPEYTRGGGIGDETGDMPTVQINPGFEAVVDGWLVLFGALELNFEPEDNALLVDEIYFVAGDMEFSPVSIKGGYYTSPFGDFDTLHNASPLPEGAFETKGDVIEMAYSADGFAFDVFAIRGRRDWVLRQFTGTRDEPQNQDWRWGAGVKHRTTVPGAQIAVDFGITNAIFSSSELVYSVPDRSGGLGANARIGFGNEELFIWMQYVSALETVDLYNEDEAATAPSVPSAFAVEFDASHDFPDFTAFFAASYSRSWDLESVLPQEQVIVTAGIEIERLRFLVEYGHQWDYPSSGSGDRATAQFVTCKAVFGY